MTIKALEARQKDMQSQIAAAQQGGITPENTQTPIQGFGHVANMLGDSFRQSRADEAVAAQKQALAATIAGIDLEKGPNAQQLAAIGTADPDTMRQMLTQIAEARRQQAGFAHDDTFQKAGFQHADTAQQAGFGHADATQSRLFGHQDTAAAKVTEDAQAAAAAEVQAKKDAAAEAARVAQVAADAQEKRLLARPSDDTVAKINLAEKNGEITAEQAAAERKKAMAAGVPEQKFITEQSEKSIEAQSLLGTLDNALGLLNSPKGIHTGNYAAKTQTIGEHVPKFLQGNQYLPDPETTKNTQRYNQIMGAEVLDAVTRMKGSSSDRDVDLNIKIANDPNASVEAKRDAIMVLKNKLPAMIANHNKAIAGAGGEAPQLPKAPTTLGSGGSTGGATGMSEADIAASLANAQKAVDSGKWTKEQANAKLKAAGVPKGL